MTTNRECLVTDPLKLELLNQGVAEVKDLRSEEELRILRFELETFVCKGQYAKGLERILECFNGHIGQVQPAAWVSGFFGSGKSHLVKMLRALWTDQPFADGQRPRGITKLNDEVNAALTELGTRTKQAGGAFAAAGTLSSQSQSGAGTNASVRLAILAIVFRACDLPERVFQARFVLWLKSEGHFDKVKAFLDGKGKIWARELNNLGVSPVMAEALHTIAGLGTSPREVGGILKATYPERDDVSNGEMVALLSEAITTHLRLPADKFPLTLIALDEVQQYIGKDQARSLAIQEVVECLRGAHKGCILVVATGQSAITDTPDLQKLAGRFPPMARVVLTDQDVDTVIRNVLLSKKPTALPAIDDVLNRAIGEISRHLVGTSIGAKAADRDDLAADYPLLPVRRRFWEKVLKHIDYTGTSGQLRNQLCAVHAALRQVANAPLGHVIPADVIYDQLKTQTGMAQVIGKDTFEAIERYSVGDADSKLKGRLLGLIFLIGRFDRSTADHGVRAKEDTLADLLVENLLDGSGDLRKRIGALLQELQKENQVLLIDEEYRVQTSAGREWEDHYNKKRSALTGKPQKLREEASLIIQKHLVESLGKLSRPQGTTAVNREVVPYWGDTPPKEDGALPVWFIEGSSRSEAEFLAQVNGAGSESSAVFVRLRHPGASFEDLVATLRAAETTLRDRQGAEAGDGLMAEGAMKTRKKSAEESITEKLNELLQSAQVYLGGGVPVQAATLREQIDDAIAKALARRYPKFAIADTAGWSKVVTRAKAGNPDALSQIGHTGEPDKHPVAIELISAIGSGIKGKDLRARFEGGAYGWDRDAIDGALLTLVAAGQVRAAINGAPVTATGLDQSKIGQADFQMEKAVLSATDRMLVRKVIQDFGLPCKAGEEAGVVVEYLRNLKERALAAGGTAPAPASPATTEIDALLGRPAGSNEQLVAVAAIHKQLTAWAAGWKALGEQVAKRQGRWMALQELLRLAETNHLPGLGTVKQQAQAISDQRALLKEPDLVEPLIKQVSSELASALHYAGAAYATAYDTAWNGIEADAEWKKLPTDDRNAIPRAAGLAGPVALKLGTPEETIATARQITVPHLKSLLDALPERVGKVLHEAAKRNEPQIQSVRLSSKVLKTEAEVQAWLDATKAELLTKLKSGPVRV